MDCKQIKYSITHKRLYGIWHSMKSRCYNKKSINYDRYGGKDVSVCDEWKNNFEAFLNWSMSNGYQEVLTIDRIDSTKNYSPNNCRWVDYYIQEQNRSVTKRSTTGYKGVFTDKQHNCYKVEIMRNGKRVFLGRFKDLDEAVSVSEQYYEEQDMAI